MTFGFRVSPENAKALNNWTQEVWDVVFKYQEDNPGEQIVNMFGEISTTVVSPTGDSAWRVERRYIWGVPDIKSLVITEDVEAVEDCSRCYLSIDGDDYRTLLEHGWAFEKARSYEYRFSPSSVMYFTSVRPLDEKEWVLLTDLDNF